MAPSARLRRWSGIAVWLTDGLVGVDRDKGLSGRVARVSGGPAPSGLERLSFINIKQKRQHPGARPGRGPPVFLPPPGEALHGCMKARVPVPAGRPPAPCRVITAPGPSGALPGWPQLRQL